MAEIETILSIDNVHGKLKKSDKGYFYVRNGKQFYRDREETYQKKQSPRQKWNSEAFAYANRQLALLKSSPESEQLLRQEYEASKSYRHEWQRIRYALGLEIQFLAV